MRTRWADLERVEAMPEEHPNLVIIREFDPRNIAGSADVLAEDVVFHFFNSQLPDVEGDYIGLEGIQSFFETLGQRTNGTFEVNPISMTAVGNQLVVVQTRNRMILDDQQIETDVVIVFRIIEGRITEVWDIPSV